MKQPTSFFTSCQLKHNNNLCGAVNIFLFFISNFYALYCTPVMPRQYVCVCEVRQTWSRVCLWRTLDHRAAGETGQNHGRHDLIHLHWLWAAETEQNTEPYHQHLVRVTLTNSYGAISPSPVPSLCTSSQVAPASLGLPLRQVNRSLVMAALHECFLSLDRALSKHLQT